MILIKQRIKYPLCVKDNGKYSVSFQTITSYSKFCILYVYMEEMASHSRNITILKNMFNFGSLDSVIPPF